MKVLLWGLILFALAFHIHFIIWKVHSPKNQIKVLLQIFFGTLIICSIGLWSFAAYLESLGFSMLDALPEFIHIALIFISLSLAYIVTYTAVEVDSPSLVIVMNIANAGSEGMDKLIFYTTMTDDILVKPRIRDLIDAGIAYLDGDKYRLTPKGIVLARIFIFYRKLMNNNSIGG